MAQVRYGFNQLARDALNEVQYFVREETGALDCVDINILLEALKMT